MLAVFAVRLFFHVHNQNRLTNGILVKNSGNKTANVVNNCVVRICVVFRYPS